MKPLTRKQVETRKAKAVHFTRDVRDDPGRAEEIEDEPLEDYAQRRHIQIVNPKGGRKMPVPTRRELMERIEELEEDNENLQSRLDEISDIVGDEEEEEESGEE